MSKNGLPDPERGELKSREPQYQECIEAALSRGFERLGLRASQSWHEEPKHLLFRLARYKFVAKMLAGAEHVLEIGCGDAFGTCIVQQYVKRLSATDFDAVFLEDVEARMVPRWHFTVFQHDPLAGPIAGSYDGVFALDVLEHIRPRDEDTSSEEHPRATPAACGRHLRHAFAREPGPCFGHEPGWSRQLQEYAGLQKHDAALFPQRVHVLDERRSGTHGIPPHGPLLAGAAKKQI
ncbi:MAG: methyltransferase domain-containing protein [Pseudomonadota bacterium]|jgi:hypothetical protein